MISSKWWTELCKRQLYGKIRRFDAFDCHQLTLLGSRTSKVEWNGSRRIQTQPQSDKKFGLLGGDFLHKHDVNKITTEHLPALKDYEAHVKLIPRLQPIFCKARKDLYLFMTRSQRSWNRWSDRTTLNRYSQEESLMHLQWCGRERRVENWDLVCTWKCRSMASSGIKDYPISDVETTFHNLYGAPYFGKIDLSDAYYQTEHDEEAKDICKISTSQGLFKMCPLPQGLKNCSSIFQNCIEKVFWSFNTMCWSMELARSSSTRESLQSRGH